jgi:hypothetical protein
VGFRVEHHQLNWLSALLLFIPELHLTFCGWQAPYKRLRMYSDPYDEFAQQHRDVAGRTRGIRSGKAAQEETQGGYYTPSP